MVSSGSDRASVLIDFLPGWRDNPGTETRVDWLPSNAVAGGRKMSVSMTFTEEKDETQSPRGGRGLWHR